MKKRLVIILLAAVMLVALMPAAALADSSGWNSATGYNDSDAVLDPGCAYASDNDYAYFPHSWSSVDYTFGNDIVPSTAIIQGIEVRVEASRGYLSDNDRIEVSLRNGGQLGDSKTTGKLTTSDVVYTLGGTSNKWGYSSWTADLINSGFEVRVENTSSWMNPYVDCVQLRVSYSLPASTTTVTSSSSTSTYGQSVTFTATVSPSTATGTVEFFVDGSSIGSAAVSGGSAAITTSALSVGNHTVRAEYGGSSSYQASSGTCSQKVNKAATTTTVTSSNNPSGYGQSVTFTANISPSGATGTVQFSIDGSSFGSPVAVSGGSASITTSNLSVGSHTVTAAYSGSASYTASSGTLSGGQTVNKAATTTTVTSSHNPSTYGQSVMFTANVSPSATGTVQFSIDGSPFGAPVTVSGGSASISTSSLSAGNHTVAAAYSGNASYATSSGTLSGGQTVNKLATTTTVSSSDNTTTFGESITFTANVSPSAATGTVRFFVDGSSLGSPVAVSGGTATLATSSLSAGNHTVRAEYSGDSVYAASSGTLSGGQTVAKTDATINVDGANVTYDGAAHGATGTATGADGSNLTSLLDFGDTFVNVPGGTANWSFAGDANHNPASGSVAIVINKADAVIEVSGANVTYDGAAHGATGTATGADGSDLTSLLDLGSSFTNVPGGTANWSFAGDANHNPASGSVAIVISKADAVIVVSGANVTYDGTAHGATGTATGVDGSDLTSLLNLGSSFTNVPGGTANWSFAGDANHKPASGSVDIVISKAVLTVTAMNKTVQYGSAPPVYNAKYEGFVTGENINNALTGAPSLSCTYVQGDSVGTYTIVITQNTLVAANYQFTFVNGTLDVNKALLTVTADSLNITYGDAKPTLTYTITGYVLGEGESVLGGTAPTISCAYAQWNDAGSYPIDIGMGALAATNYQFTFLNGTLTVNKMEIAVTAISLSINYGDAEPAYTYRIEGFEESEWPGIVSGTAVLDCSYDQGDNAGDYEITVDVSQMSATNFSFRAVNGTLTVNRVVLDVTPDDFTITYGDAAPAYTAKISGFVNGDDENDLTGSLLFNCTYTAGKPVNTYGIGCSGLDSDNYQIIFHTGLLTVKKAPLTVTADDKTVTFLDAAPAYTARYGGFVAGDNAADLGGTLAYDCSYASGSAVGTYPITPSGLTSTNYDITFIPGTLTVNNLILTVRFVDYNGTELKSEQVIYGNAATAPTGMTREGYNFTGWDTLFNSVKANLTVTAQYAIKTFTVSFYRVDGTTQIGATQTVNWGSAALFETAPGRTGFAFDQWVLTGDDNTVVTSLTNVRENITAVASYIRNGYTVTFVDYNGNVIGTDGVLYGGAAVAPDVPEREGYTFTGWDTSFNPVTSNLTVTALYSINTYTVTFVDYDGTVLATQTVDWNTGATAPAEPTREGFEFTGWDAPFDAVRTDTTITAQYAEISSIDDEEIPDTNGTIEDEPVPAAGGGFAWWWIPIIIGAAAVLFFLIFFVARRKKKEEENA